MNIYQKLAQARLELKMKGLKPSGSNKYAGYTYFDLCDILPTVTEIEQKLGMLSVVRFEAEKATLTVYNTENDSANDNIVFSSPMSTAELKGCHQVQNLGAVETYIRRYLYMAAYGIVESDVLDKGEEEKPQGESCPKMEKTELEKAKETKFLYKDAQHTLNECTLEFLQAMLKRREYETIHSQIQLLIAEKEKTNAV